jgi:NAD(P)-dependent dehydrogenase (short-subunit alcohol dehydrogenase family)
MKPLNEQIMLVTGATDGIGKITARGLARAGATVILHGRNPQKCRAVMEEIREAGGSANLECVSADFASLSDVREMAAALRTTHDHLDVLINNAGILPAGKNAKERLRSAQGYDLCFAVNYLAPFLLTHLLLPVLRASSAARIVNVSSGAQEPIDFDDLMLAHNYSPMRAYAQSKLALAMFTFELDERLTEENITVNCVHPGTLLDTKLVRQASIEPRGSAESGAEVLVHLATAHELEGVSGLFFDRKTQSQAHTQAYDREARQQLWQLSLEMTDLAHRVNV